MEETWFCEACGETHDGVPFTLKIRCPSSWTDGAAVHPESELLDAHCVIGGERFFLHGFVLIPVTDAERDFEWGIWVEVDEKDFLLRCARWSARGRERDAPVPGRLAVTLPGYGGSTLGIPGLLQDREVGLRPVFTLTDAGHPLAREQRLGITMARVIDLARASH
ncbi:DUF2199 domain-containing protein [Conexibacter woesei]|uniref:DUF2199 domain-containing protein n=1 Tax=Conexibacter woesei TaxID=191495 RepID=UPI000415EC49|nr:DUF2199 domain-containing protein [Conexibacter woesei]